MHRAYPGVSAAGGTAGIVPETGLRAFIHHLLGPSIFRTALNFTLALSAVVKKDTVLNQGSGEFSPHQGVKGIPTVLPGCACGDFTLGIISRELLGQDVQKWVPKVRLQSRGT